MAYNCEKPRCQAAHKEYWKKFRLLRLAYFWSKVDVRGISECWEWKSTITSRGYGGFTVDHKPKLAHRLAYQFTFGEIPPGLFVCHHCDNPKCVNPTHLFLGTNSDNQLDSSKKGRKPSVKGKHNPMYGKRGENSPVAKITNAEAKAIREMYASGKFFQREIAERFGIGQASVSQIVLNKIFQVQAPT